MFDVDAYIARNGSDNAFTLRLGDWKGKLPGDCGPTIPEVVKLAKDTIGSEPAKFTRKPMPVENTNERSAIRKESFLKAKQVEAILNGMAKDKGEAPSAAPEEVKVEKNGHTNRLTGAAK
jgi:hypothetical protein